MGHGFLCEQEDGLKIRIDDTVKVLFTHFLEREQFKDAGVIDENVQFAIRLNGFIHQMLQIFFFHHITGDEDGFATMGFNFLEHGSAALFIAAVNYDLGAFFCEQKGTMFPDAGGGSGDQYDFVL